MNYPINLLRVPEYWIWFGVIGYFICLFLFFRSVKNEVDANWLYKTFTRITILLTILMLVANYISLNVYPFYYGITILYAAYLIDRSKYDIWAIFDSLTFPLLLLLITITSGLLLSYISLNYLVCLFGFIFYVILGLPWVKKRYRSFNWYPSGRNGFVFLFTNIILLVMILAVAFVNPAIIYLEKLSLGIYLLVFWVILYRRSGRRFKSEIKGIKKGLFRKKNNIYVN